MLEKLLIIALLVLSIHYTMQEGEIFEGLGKFFEKHLPEQIHPAVFACPICMVFWYGSLLYWLVPWGKIGLMPTTGNVWQWIVTVIAAMGLNIVIVKLWPDD
jgi:hypothetical protein